MKRYFLVAALACTVLLVMGSVALADGTPTAPVDGAAAIALLNTQRVANGIPPLTTVNQAFASAWCPAEDTGPSGGEWDRDLSGSGNWSATSNPWDSAPLHQFSMFNPLLTTAGDVNVTNQPWDGTGQNMAIQACMGLGGEVPQPASPTFYAYIADGGPSGVSPTETVMGESPFAPQMAVGIAEGVATGPQPILYAEGFPGEGVYSPTGNDVHALSWSLATSAGVTVPNVMLVDDSTLAAYGHPGYLSGGAVMVPPPLTVATTYDGSVLWAGPDGQTATQSFSFTTGYLDSQLTLTPQSEGSGLWIYTRSPAPIIVTVTALPSGALVTSKTLTPAGSNSSVAFDPGILGLPPGSYQECAAQPQTGSYGNASACQQTTLTAPAAVLTLHANARRVNAQWDGFSYSGQLAVTVRRLRGHAVGGVVAHGIISAAGNGAGNGTSGTMLFSHRLPAGRYRVCAAISTPVWWPTAQRCVSVTVVASAKRRATTNL